VNANGQLSLTADKGKKFIFPLARFFLELRNKHSAVFGVEVMSGPVSFCVNLPGE
jgi:hypothetical protein